MHRGWILLALAAIVATAGCLGGGGEEVRPSATSATGPVDEARPTTGEANVTVTWEAANEPEGVRGVYQRIIAVLASPADADGTADVLWTGDRLHPYVEEANKTREIGNGTLAAGEYDQLLVRWATAGRVGEAIPVGEERERPDPTFPEAHLTRPMTNEMGLPVDVVVEANLTLTPGANRVHLTQDVRADVEEHGLALTNVSLGHGEGGEALDHRVRLERAGALAAPAAPEADFTLEPDFDASEGPDLQAAGAPNGSFANGRSSPLMARQGLELNASPSRPSSEAEEILYVDVEATGGVGGGWGWWLFPEPFEEHSIGFERPGVHEVTVTVADDGGGIDRKTMFVYVEREEWSTTSYASSLEEAGNWTTSAAEDPPGRWTQWAKASRSFELTLREDTTKFDLSPMASYGPDAHATLRSPTIDVPEEWDTAGYTFTVQGSSQPPDRLTVEAIVDGEPREIANLTGVEGGEERRFHDRTGLADAIGGEVAFRFTFTSDGEGQEGQGWRVGSLVVGGIDLDPRNPEMLDDVPP